MEQNISGGSLFPENSGSEKPDSNAPGDSPLTVSTFPFDQGRTLLQHDSHPGHHPFL